MNDSMAENNRIAREKRTIRAMIEIYCRGNHTASNGRHLCEECKELLEYAFARLDRCPYAEKKPPCSKCTTHCYKPTLRDKIKKVMRYSGPRMLLVHPILALGHWLDGKSRIG
jgi:hypothetical protein